MPIIAWILSKLTAKIALPIMAVMLVANIGTGIALEITRNTLADRTRDLVAETKAHDADIASYQAATQTAKALDQQHALTVKEGQDQITTEKQHDLENQLVDARARAAQFVRQHPASPTVSSRGSRPAVPATPNTTGSVDGTTGSTVILASDADACAIAYTVAVGWQTWWAKEQPLWKAGAAPSMPTVGAIIPSAIVGATVRVASDDTLGAPIDLTRLIKTLPISDSMGKNENTGTAENPDQQSDQNNIGDVHKNFLP